MLHYVLTAGMHEGMGRVYGVSEEKRGRGNREKVEDELLGQRARGERQRWTKEIKHSRLVQRCLGHSPSCRDHAKTSVGVSRGCLGSGTG